MPLATCRLNDMCTGHGCFPSRLNNKGSPNYFVNNRNVHRETDTWSIHCCGISCHNSVLFNGSPNSFVNNLAIGRVTDFVACGSTVATGSPNHFTN